MKYLPLIALLLVTPAQAKDITITLNDQEQGALLKALDAALKCGGVNALGVVNQIIAKYQASQMPPPAPKK